MKLVLDRLCLLLFILLLLLLLLFPLSLLCTDDATNDDDVFVGAHVVVAVPFDFSKISNVLCFKFAKCILLSFVVFSMRFNFDFGSDEFLSNLSGIHKQKKSN